MRMRALFGRLCLLWSQPVKSLFPLCARPVARESQKSGPEPMGWFRAFEGEDLGKSRSEHRSPKAPDDAYSSRVPSLVPRADEGPEEREVGLHAQKKGSLKSSSRHCPKSRQSRGAGAAPLKVGAEAGARYQGA